jgi:hypothetical protein
MAKVSVPQWLASHPIWAVVGAIVVFAVGTFPMWLATVWPLVSNRVFIDVVAEYPWVGLVTGPLYGWLTVALGGVLVVVAIAAVVLSRVTPKPKAAAQKSPKLQGYFDGGVIGVLIDGELHLVIETVIGNSGVPGEAATFSMAIVKKDDTAAVVEDLATMGGTNMAFTFAGGPPEARRQYIVGHHNLLPQVALNNRIPLFGCIRGFMVGKVEHLTIAGMSEYLLCVGFVDNARNQYVAFASLDGVVSRDSQSRPGQPGTVRDYA